MKNIILGGNGMIGVNLSKLLLKRGEETIIIDREFRQEYESPNTNFLKADLVDEKERVFEWVDWHFGEDDELGVWHLAANSDIRSGTEDLFVDFKDTLGTTITAIEICKRNRANFLGFSSSSAIYGDKKGAPVDELSIQLEPISNYGLMKLWSEKLILDFMSQNNDIQILIYRFPNVVGHPLTHGIIKDLLEKLKIEPEEVEVLGNGMQRKQYVHVEDLIDIIYSLKSLGQSGIFNIAPNDDGVSVKQISEMLRSAISPGTNLNFGLTDYGWKGDVPVYRLDTTKLRKTGLGNTLDSLSSIQRTIMEIEY